MDNGICNTCKFESGASNVNLVFKVMTTAVSLGQ
jgi:hypothetical protein